MQSSQGHGRFPTLVVLAICVIGVFNLGVLQRGQIILPALPDTVEVKMHSVISPGSSASMANSTLFLIATNQLPDGKQSVVGATAVDLQQSGLTSATVITTHNKRSDEAAQGQIESLQTFLDGQAAPADSAALESAGGPALAPVEGATIDVVIATDEGMLPWVPTLLNSIERNNPGEVTAVHVIANNLTGPAKAVVQSYCERHFPSVRLRFVDFTRPLNYVSPLKHVSAATMSRLLMPSLLPDLDRVIYLDVDAVVNAPLRPLMELDVGHTGVAAKSSLDPNVINSWLKKAKVYGPLSYPPEKRSFNAGVLVADLAVLRSSGFEETVFDWADRYGVNDQIALNLYCDGEYGELDGSYNIFVGRDEARYPEWRVLHWAGIFKPWGSDPDSLAYAPECRRVFDSYRVGWERVVAEYIYSNTGDAAGLQPQPAPAEDSDLDLSVDGVAIGKPSNRPAMVATLASTLEEHGDGSWLLSVSRALGDGHELPAWLQGVPLTAKPPFTTSRAPAAVASPVPPVTQATAVPTAAPQAVVRPSATVTVQPKPSAAPQKPPVVVKGPAVQTAGGLQVTGSKPAGAGATGSSQTVVKGVAAGVKAGAGQMGVAKKTVGSGSSSKGGKAGNLRGGAKWQHKKTQAKKPAAAAAQKQQAKPPQAKQTAA